MEYKYDEILFIDDSVATNYYHQKVIRKHDISLQSSSFSLADDAIDYIIENPLTVRLIMLDLNMPEADGWEFLSRLKNEKLKKKTDYLMILTTATSNLEKQKIGAHPYIDAIMIKPLSIDKLKSLITP